MPDLPFPDLAAVAARKTQPPPFGQIVGRARRRRRNNLVAVAAATLAVVAVVTTGAVATLGDGQASPAPMEPPGPSDTAAPQTPDPATTADATRIARDGRLVSHAAVGRSLLTVWELCGRGAARNRCRYAWQLQSRSGIHRGLAPGSMGGHAAGEAFVLPSWDGPGILVDLDGRTRTLHQTAPGPAGPGDALVRLPQGYGLVDPASAEYWALPGTAGVEGWGDAAMAPDGTVWATTSPPSPTTLVQVSWLVPGTTSWQHHTISPSPSSAGGFSTGPVAVAGDHVAALAMHEGVDVVRFGTFALTTDGGASWSELSAADLPFDTVDAMAATSGGTLYVASSDRTGEDRLFRSTDTTWRHFAEVPDARGSYRLVAAGPQVVAVRGTPDRSEVLTLDDAGHAARWAMFG